MSQELLQQAVTLFKAGKREQARELLLKVVDTDPNNANAWYGLGACADDVEKKRYYLQKALEIDPQHSRAQQMLEKTIIVKDLSPSVRRGKTNYSIASIVIPSSLVILILCVVWLFYKVDGLEKSLTAVQKDVSATQTELKDTQLTLNSTRSSLTSTIDNLQYVQAVAEHADRYAHSHNSFSDRRLKTNISKIEDPLKGILALNGVTFFWNTAEYPSFGFSDEPQIGFIAQEVEKIYPQLVDIDANGLKTVDYEKLIPVLVEAIKQQQVMIENLQGEIIILQQK